MWWVIIASSRDWKIKKKFNAPSNELAWIRNVEGDKKLD